MLRHHWSIARAKASLSQVLDESVRAPQVIEKRGKPVAVVLSLADYQRAVGDPGAGSIAASRWSGFLRLSSELRAKGGASLQIPKRASRPSPFGRRK